ncbi:MAG: D-alanyl-D-alanine carboxypeptidase [Peptococcaceae bacterium]|nr:D-alanyl-D-alanine carboxypeptidase [Peptococcaceae bacterium]
MQRKRKATKWVTMFILITMLFTLMPAAAMADVITDTAPDAGAASYIVVEASTGEVLFGKNYQQQLAPAGTAQIMTALLAIESGKLDTEVTVPTLPDYNASGAVTVHLGKGERYTLRSLVEVMLVSSANDAAYVVADEVGGSVDKFVTKMNAKAKEIGMENTVFKNPNGMDEEGQLVTAEDMAKLARYAMQNETFREMVMLQQVNWKGVSYEKPMPNTNKLFSIMPETTGLKSGSSAAAQYALVASAQRENRELIGVILGAPDEAIYQNMKKVLTYGFEHTKIVPVVKKDTLETTLEYGDKQVRIVAGEDYSVIQSTDSASIVTYQRKLTDVELPVRKDSQVGQLQVMVDNVVIHEVPLIALDEMRKPINWLFVVTLLLSVVYIASIISRIVTNARRAQRKKEAAGRVVQNTAPSKKNQYDYLMNSVEHPKQQAKTNKKTLTSSRDRNQNR